MGFDVGAEAYDRFMGRYSVGLAAQLADLAGVAAGQQCRSRLPSPPFTVTARAWAVRGRA